MPLNKLDNFIKNTEGRIIYVNPDDLDSTDSISNEGNSLARPFKTIQRALLEAARFSYVKGDNNDITEKTTILLFPGEHVIDNRPGFAIYDNSGAKAVSRSGAESVASTVFGLGLDSNFDLTQEDNILYKFNSYYGGVIVPRGTSIVGLDLRKTKIRPKYVPNPTDDAVAKSALFRLTGACYIWQFSMFDADPSGTVYTNPDDSGSVYKATPNFSHHKLTCFEFCDGVNKIGSYDLTDLDMFYSKVSNAFNAYRDIDQKFPASPLGFNKKNPEWEIVGAFASDPINISNIISGNGSTANSIVTVTTETDHGLNQGTPIRIRGVGGSGVIYPYNISTTVQNVTGARTFTYLLPNFNATPNLNPAPSSSTATVTVETDTVQGASPYIFNISLRSVWGMNGMHADGSKAAGFRSTVVAQFTAISLQKDDRAFAKYNSTNRTYEKINYSAVNGAAIPDGASASGEGDNQAYHLDSGAVYRQGWETSHIKMSNDAFVQVVSVFAIGFNKHFDAESGADASITNSNSNFGQISLISDGFKKEAFGKDNNAFITNIIPPREIESVEDKIEWLSLDVGVTTSVGISSHLYISGFSAKDSKPSTLTQGFRIGAKQNDKLYVIGAGVTLSADIYMCDNIIGSGTTALGTTSSVKSHDVTGEPSSNSFTIGSHSILTGEKVIIISDDGDLPEGIVPHQVYFAIDNGDNNTVKLASSYTNAIRGTEVTANKGTSLRILSRVSDKDSGDVGSPIQFDSENNNWFIHVDADNSIYSAFNTGGTATYGTKTDLSYVNRISDERSLDEKLYKVRVVVPKETPNAKDPESAFVIQESSSTGGQNSTDFTKTVIDETDYNWLKNPRFILTCSESSGTVTVTTELPHNLNVNDIVNIKNVKSSTNSTGEFNVGYNGRFTVTAVTDSVTFTYSTTDVDGKVHSTGTFSSDVNTRDQNLPRYEKNDLKSNIYTYRNEVISEYIYNQQDGVYHLYLLNAGNSMDTEFTDLTFSQLPTDLYPQLDRDNVDSNPQSAKTFAKRSPIGETVTNDLKKSITRETIDTALTKFGQGLDISSVNNGTGEITFTLDHGLAGIQTGNILAAGALYNSSGSGTFHNVKLYNDSALTNWSGATAKVTVTTGAISSPTIVSSGSSYSAGTYYFDQIEGTGENATLQVYATGISTAVNDVVQITGAGTTSDGYYRITSIDSEKIISVARTTGDPNITTDQYALIVGPAAKITSVSSLDSSTGIVTFTSTGAHGLVAGNKFRVVDSSNNNLGDFIVKQRVSTTQFTSVTNKSISASDGWILKHGLSSNKGISDIRTENLGSRGLTLYANDKFTLSSAITADATSISFENAGRLPLGSYIQIDSEILRIVSSGNVNSATVLRGALATLSDPHDANSLIRRVEPIAIEFRRPSYVRASGHTFEYLGYGPGNYSTGLPQVQDRSLTEREEFLSQAQERSCGVVAYTGMNNDGDFFIGNQRKSSATGEETTFDTPVPTITGDDPSKLSVVFDEVTVKERLLVEGGDSAQVLSQFDGPVTFNQNVNLKAPTFASNVHRFTGNNSTSSTTTGDIVVTGGVGIGENLHIGGTLNVDGAVTVSSGVFKNIQVAITDDNTIDTSSGHLKLSAVSGSTVAIQTNTTITGILSVTDDITAFYSSSDERLKNNITPIEDPLAKVLSISGNTFEWKELDNYQGEDTGVIAQEVEALGLPGIVKNNSNGYKSVQYHKLVPLLIEAVKELNNKVDILEQKLNDK